MCCYRHWCAYRSVSVCVYICLSIFLPSACLPTPPPPLPPPKARERMRQKFGGSSGLSSSGTGRMQGIGSDPTYTATGAALDTHVLTEQFSKASQSALSLVSSVWETTTKVNLSIPPPSPPRYTAHSPHSPPPLRLLPLQTVQEAKIGDQVSQSWRSFLAEPSGTPGG